jgi:hypothetical protein
MPVPAFRWSACDSPLKPVAAPGLLTTGVPRGDGGCSVAARLAPGSRLKVRRTPESCPDRARGAVFTAPLGTGADVPYRDAEPVVWVGWSTPPTVFGAAEATADGPNATSSPVQSEGTSSSRHLRRPVGGDPRPNLVEDPRDDQGVRICDPSRSRMPPAPYHSGLRGHAGMTVSLYETLFRTESNNHGKQPSMIYRIVIFS